MLHRPDDADQIVVARDVVDALTVGSELTVRVRPETGCSVTHDWWSAAVDELGVAACEFGFDATIAALMPALRAEVVARLEEPRLETAATLALVTRLKLADERDWLGAAIEEACQYSGTTGF